VARAEDMAACALSRLPVPRPNPREFLCAANIRVLLSDDNPHFGGTTLRAIYCADTRTVTLYRAALAELKQAADDLPCTSLEDVILAHETFHFLCPEYEGVEAEVAANLFATEWLRLTWYAGLLDPLTVLYRRTEASSHSSNNSYILRSIPGNDMAISVL
jgi:hypothetical protein